MKNLFLILITGFLFVLGTGCGEDTGPDFSSDDVIVEADLGADVSFASAVVAEEVSTHSEEVSYTLTQLEGSEGELPSDGEDDSGGGFPLVAIISILGAILELVMRFYPKVAGWGPIGIIQRIFDMIVKDRTENGYMVMTERKTKG